MNYATSFLFSPESDTSQYDIFLYNTTIRAYAQTSDLKAKAIDLYNNVMLERKNCP
jgi:pentatricopeptide repeat protein